MINKVSFQIHEEINDDTSKIYIVTLLDRTVSAVTQNQPLRVEIKGFKTGHYLGVKTALVGLVNAGPKGQVECPHSEFTTSRDFKFKLR